MSKLIGKTLGGFRVEQQLGHGGMGVVLLARQDSLDRPAVLKRIRRDLCELPELTQRFEREARAAAQIHHANVVAVYDYFQWRSDLFIAQEYVDGLDLETLLARTGALPWRIAAMIALELARGLEEIHALGTLHRDLKPANVLIGRRGEVKIGDFGLALEATGSSLTGPGVAIGSPSYMPPEQMLGERVDARSDLFSLGVIFYEMLAGRPPFASSGRPEGEAETRSTQDAAGDSMLERMRKERYTRIRRHAPGTPRALARCIRRCLRAKPSQRPHASAEVRRRLEKTLGSPSPADLRSELAGWLWQHPIFEPRRNETLVQVAPPRTATASLGRRWLLPALITGLAILAAGSILLIDFRPLSGGADTRAVPTLGSAPSDTIPASRNRLPAAP